MANKKSHMALRTSELDGRVERVMEMPEESPIPLLTALSILGFVLSMIFSSYWMVGVFALAGTVAISWWQWHRPDVE